MKFLKLIAVVAAAASTGLLGACGSNKTVTLNGVQPGMTIDAVQAIAPTGAGLYCNDEEHAVIHSVIGGGVGPTRKHCVWEIAGSAGGNVEPVAVGGQTSSAYSLDFVSSADGAWHLDSFRIVMPYDAYPALVRAETAVLGVPKDMNEPDYALVPITGMKWSAGEAELTVVQDPGFGSPSQALVTLSAKAKDKA